MGRRTQGSGTFVGSRAHDRPAPDDGRSARASMVVAGFTGLSRISGVARVLAIGAVLGPTHLGNAYQVTNALPNLIWYGFLAGSLVPAMLVPILVQQLQLRAQDRVETLSRGFLGVAALAGLLITPVAMVGLPLLLQLATLGIPTEISQEQIHLARILVLLTVPQTFLYALIGTAGAVMFAHRRFALPSVGPTVENLGVIVVIGVVAGGYGASGATGTAPLGELVLLGAGSTAAVALNAALQFWGAARCGVRLLPAWGWRDPTVRAALKRTSHSLLSAALLAVQTLLVLLLASRVAGGAVAVQVAFNFYVLPVALIGTPIGLALLPELSLLVHAHQRPRFEATMVRAIASAVFLAAPASVGYLLLAGPVAAVAAAGQMDTAFGRAMISGSLAALSVGLVGQVVCFVVTQASYARADTRTPLRCMAVQALTCLLLCGAAVVLLDGPALVVGVAVAYAVAALVGGLLLLVTVSRPAGDLLPRLAGAAGRSALGVALMALAVEVVAALTTGTLHGHLAGAVTLGLGSLTGVVVYVGLAWLVRAPELAWWVSGLRRSRSEPVTEVTR